MEEKSKVPAIDKADKIFNYLYYKYSATQSSISKDLNLPKATVNRLLEVLTNLKYLNYQDKEYTLGEKFYFFSNRYEKYTLIKNITHPYLEELSLKFKETFKLSVLDNDKIRSIATVESSDLIKVSVAENAIFPLHAGAASKLLICQLSESKLNKLLTKTLPKYTDNTITDREKLKEELKKVEISDSFVPYIANVTADYVTKKEEVKPLLASQVSSSVRWQQTIERLLADGADEFVEIGPGRTLSGFVKKVNRDVKVSSIDKMEDFIQFIGSHVEAGAC